MNNEQKYQHFFETFGDPLLIIQGGRFVDCNPAAVSILGYDEKDDILVPPGKLSPVFQGDGRPSEEKAKEMIDIAFARGHHQFEWLHTKKDGGLICVEVSLTAQQLPTGDTLFTSWRDISERKRAEQALRESEMKLHAIFDHHYQLTGLISPDGRLRAANQTALRMVDAAESDVLGKYFWEGPWWSPAQHDEVRNAVNRSLNGEFVRFKTVHFDKGGEKRYMDFSLSPVRDDDGNVFYVVPEGRDITDMKRAEDARMESLARFSGFANASQYGMGMADLDGRITYVNATLVRMLGEKTEADCLGKHFPSTYYAPHMARKLTEEVLPALMTSGTWHGELELQAADGRTILTDENYFVINGEDGEPQHLAKILTDITGRKRNENALRESEARLRALSDNLPGGMTYQMNTDPEGKKRKFTYVSAGVIKLHELSAEAVLRDAGLLYCQIHEDDREILAEAEDTAVANMSTFVAEVRFRMPSGATHWHLLSSAPRNAPNGELLWDGIEIDITDRKKAELESAKLQEQLHQSDKMQAVGHLAGGVAHDFNNQLAGIMGFADLLLDQVGDQRCKGYAKNIIKSAEHSSRLTRQLLAFSRKGKNVVTTVNIHELLSEVVGIIRRSIDKRIEVQEDFNATPATVSGDSTQLQNAFLNLAINARDAMPDGGTIRLETQTIELSSPDCEQPPFEVPAGKYLKVSVCDTGTGMSEETQNRAFEPFYTTKSKEKGTGMGLASVFGTVKSHAGAIGLASELNRGTTIDIYLPLAAEDAATTDVAASVPARNASPMRRRGSILLVDDENLLRELGVEMLQKIGYKVSVCADGAEAVESYKQKWREIDLVILDVNMPRMRGTEVFRALQEINPGVRVIVASGYALTSEIRQLLANGAVAFLNKPMRLQALSEAVAQGLSSGDISQK